MNKSYARHLFVGAHDKTFLDSACVGLAPATAKEAIESFLAMAVHCPARDVSEHHIRMDQMKEAALDEACVLFNSDPTHVALIESTTHGLNIAANAILFEKGDEVILCDTEYLQVAIPFCKKQEAGELTIVPLVTPPSGIITIDQFERLITKRTKAICVSSVQWCTGQRVFTKELGELCRNSNIWLIIDGVQEAGALSIDVAERYADFYVAGGHKWLNAPYGCGIMYLSSRALTLSPCTYGYLNLDKPEGGWGKFFQDPNQTPFRSYNFPACAKSFAIGGTGNYPGAIGLGQAIKIINDLGKDTVQDRILSLSSALKQSLRKVGARIMSSDAPDHSSGITIFRLFDDPTKDLAALDYLLEKRILLSIRYTNGHGGLRASTHFYNSEQDIDHLCHAIKHLL